MLKLLFIIGFYIIYLCSVRAEEAIFLAPHRVVYDFQMDNASWDPVVIGMSGRMVHEIKGSACQGYTTHTSLGVRVYTEGMPVRLMSQEVKTYTTGDGHRFHFDIKKVMEKNVGKSTEGIAELTKNGTLVKLKKPEENVYRLEKADFPITSLKNIIRHAKAGHRFYNTTLFDGDNGGDRVIKESVVIGEKKKSVSDSEIKELKKLDESGYWHVIVSHFDDTKNKDGLPIYRQSFHLYENGVVRHLLIDYGDFSIRLKLKSLQFLDEKNDLHNCKLNNIK
ncbi:MULTISPECIES: EipB family protein [Bartonella]|uniref:Uncharacterized protein n=1 Tax=Bartonella rochalimae ATCC BAA-1498 TaxID=685782 RepID=E6YM73_9HYPH|nr:MULTISPECIES: DUF1849 family protein [Bartonella]AQX18230.1 protein of unknown function (DUF1849) [Bartonella sp. A1379B]AQX22745.1 protein of unknown function (DUF1849) [Bartonella sp. 11B]AQX23969.1 protein of unknown function (DUF1849) [Bartonella sp. 114]AQX25194.1 protein of unknown function (DUF1849) [Bartonella sp. Coyote22sub2]KEC56951.1 hypothetical protein O99_00373 [Bartonella rochalimae ATCC BAA-1498]